MLLVIRNVSIIYPFGLIYIFHLNTFSLIQIVSRAYKLNWNKTNLPLKRVKVILEVQNSLKYCSSTPPFSLKYSISRTFGQKSVSYAEILTDNLPIISPTYRVNFDRRMLWIIFCMHFIIVVFHDNYYSFLTSLLQLDKMIDSFHCQAIPS